MTPSCLYEGRVIHRRLRPFGHRFAYRVFSLLVDPDELPALHGRLRFFSHNRFNLLSFHDRDHGPRDGSPLRPWVEAAMASHGLEPDGGPIRLLCFPRVLGYVFDPLSVYFVHGRDHRLRAILYEVKNTFGEQHCYLLEAGNGRADGEPVVQSCPKSFHVSPFIGMEATYRFRVEEPGERLAVLIREDDAGGPLLVASLSGVRRPLDDRSLLARFARHPLMTVKVIAAIHWQALRLWIARAPFHRHPGSPKEV